MTNKWDEMSAYAVVKEILSHDPALLHAVIQGMMAGQQEAMSKLQEELQWANLSYAMALSMALGDRMTAGAKSTAEHVLRERIKRFPTTMPIEDRYLETPSEIEVLRDKIEAALMAFSETQPDDETRMRKMAAALR